MGGRKRTISDEEILEIFRDAVYPFLSTTEAAERMGLQQPGAYDRLMQLSEKDELMTKNYSRMRLWWLPERVELKTDEGQHRE